MIFTGCASPKKIAYLQHAEDENYDATRYQHNIKVMPKDNLTIYITATDQEAVSIFNKHIAAIVISIKVVLVERFIPMLWMTMELLIFQF